MNGNIILITTLVITVIGVLVGFGLVFAGKKFRVDVDERETAVREGVKAQSGKQRDKQRQGQKQ